MKSHRRIGALALFASISLLSACEAMNKFAGLPVNEGNGYRIQHIENTYHGVTITYEHAQLLQGRSAEQAALAFKDAQPSQSEGGRIIVHIDSPSLEGARGSNYEMILMKAGQEISRMKGSSGTPNASSQEHSGRHFWSVSVVRVNEKVEDNIDLYVVNTPAARRDHFRIHAPGK